jgi:hypothetical protein
LPAIASHNTKETTSRGPEIIFDTAITSGKGEVSSLEVPITITHTTGMIIPTMGMIIRTTTIMTTMLAGITMGNTRQPK